MFDLLSYLLFPTSWFTPRRHSLDLVGYHPSSVTICEASAPSAGVAEFTSDELDTILRPPIIQPNEEVHIFSDNPYVVEGQQRAGIQRTSPRSVDPSELLPPTSASSSGNTSASIRVNSPAWQSTHPPPLTRAESPVRHACHPAVPSKISKTRPRSTSLREVVVAGQDGELVAFSGSEDSSSNVPRTSPRKVGRTRQSRSQSLLLRSLTHALSSRDSSCASSPNPSSASSRESSCYPSHCASSNPSREPSRRRSSDSISSSSRVVPFPSSGADILTKRLAPLPRFNPFMRMRSESLTSIVHSAHNGDTKGALCGKASLASRPRCKSTSDCMSERVQVPSLLEGRGFLP